MKLIEKLYCKLQKYYSIVTFEIVVVNAAIMTCNTIFRVFAFVNFLWKVKGLKILPVEVAPSQGNKFLRLVDTRYVKYDNFINVIKTFKQSFSKWVSYEKLRRNILIIVTKLSYFIHLVFMADIPFTLKVMWTFFVGRLTLVDMTLWNHSRPSVRPSVRLFVTKLSQDWVISFFWYSTWW